MNDDPYRSPQSNAQGIEFIDLSTAPLADRSLRFLGALIDGIIVSALQLGLLYVWSQLSGEEFLLLRDELGLGLFIGSILLGLASFFVVNGRLIFTRGQTVGKYLLGTQVVTDSGFVISGQEYVLKRYLPIALLSILPIIGFFIALIDALLIFRANHKCLHDDIAKTRVIKL